MEVDLFDNADETLTEKNGQEGEEGLLWSCPHCIEKSRIIDASQPLRRCTKCGKDSLPRFGQSLESLPEITESWAEATAEPQVMIGSDRPRPETHLEYAGDIRYPAGDPPSLNKHHHPDVMCSDLNCQQGCDILRFMELIWEGNYDAVEAKIKSNPFLVSSVCDGPNGLVLSALTLAALANHSSIARLLIKAGAATNMPEENTSALYEAVKLQNVKTAKVLLEFGAYPDFPAAAYSNMTPRQLAYQMGGEIAAIFPPPSFAYDCPRPGQRFGLYDLDEAFAASPSTSGTRRRDDSPPADYEYTKRKCDKCRQHRKPCDFDLGVPPTHACKRCRSKGKAVEEACKSKLPTVKLRPRKNPSPPSQLYTTSFSSNRSRSQSQSQSIYAEKLRTRENNGQKSLFDVREKRSPHYITSPADDSTQVHPSFELESYPVGSTGAETTKNLGVPDSTAAKAGAPEMTSTDWEVTSNSSKHPNRQRKDRERGNGRYRCALCKKLHTVCKWDGTPWQPEVHGKPTSPCDHCKQRGVDSCTPVWDGGGAHDTSPIPEAKELTSSGFGIEKVPMIAPADASQEIPSPMETRKPAGRLIETLDKSDEGNQAAKGDKKYIDLKDPRNLIFTFQYELANTMQGIDRCISQSFDRSGDLGKRVANHEYYLLAPDGKIIPPLYWEDTIKPQMIITMVMQPIPGFPPSTLLEGDDEESGYGRDVGFKFPYNIVETESSMVDVVRQAFKDGDGAIDISDITEGRFDLHGPDGERIPLQNWGSILQAGMFITMNMWSLRDTGILLPLRSAPIKIEALNPLFIGFADQLWPAHKLNPEILATHSGAGHNNQAVEKDSVNASLGESMQPRPEELIRARGHTALGPARVNELSTALPPPLIEGDAEGECAAIGISTHVPLLEPALSSAHAALPSLDTPRDLPTSSQSFEIENIQNWSAQEVCAWLKSLEIPEKIVDAFHRNEITGGEMLALGWEDLKDLDLPSFGNKVHLFSELMGARFNLDQLESQDAQSAFLAGTSSGGSRSRPSTFWSRKILHSSSSLDESKPEVDGELTRVESLPEVMNISQILIRKGEEQKAKIFFGKTLEDIRNQYGSDSQVARDYAQNFEILFPSVREGIMSEDSQRDSISDTFSIISYDDSAFSNLMQSEVSIEPTALRQIVHLFTADNDLRGLIADAPETLPFDKLKRNFGRLIRHYAGDLKRQATTKIEKDVARLIKGRYQFLAFEISSSFCPQEKKNDFEALRQETMSQGEFAIERFLTDTYQHKIKKDPDFLPQAAIEYRDESLSDSEGDPLDVDEHADINLPNLRQLGSFLLSEAAFGKLKRRLFEFICQNQPKDAIDHDLHNTSFEICKDRVFADAMDVLSSTFILRQHSTNSRFWSLVNDWKLYFDTEKKPISFWPLSQPRPTCKDGYTRFYWDCRCGIEMCIDVLSTDAHKYAHQTPTTTQPQSRNSSGSSTAQPPSQQESGTEARKPLAPSQFFQSARPQVGTKAPPSYKKEHKGALIFWCAKEKRDKKVMKIVEINYDTDDESLFNKFVEAYNLIRGWRRYFSLTEIRDIKYVNFWRLRPSDRGDGVCDYFKEALPPPDVGYESPSKPLPPLLGSELLQHFNRPALQADLECSGYLLKLMPQRIAGPLPPEGRQEGYGLEAVDARAPLKIAILVILTYLITTVPFAWWWLVHRPWDLQNAFTPAFYATGLIVGLLNVPDIHEII